MNRLLLNKHYLLNNSKLVYFNKYKCFSEEIKQSNEQRKKFPDFMDKKPNNKTKENIIWKKTQAYKNLKLKRLFDEKNKGPQTFEERDKEDWRNFTAKKFGRQYTSLHDKWQIRLFRTKRLKENNKSNFNSFVS